MRVLHGFILSICIYYVLTCRVQFNYAWSFSPSCPWFGVSRLCVCRGRPLAFLCISRTPGQLGGKWQAEFNFQVPHQGTAGAAPLKFPVVNKGGFLSVSPLYVNIVLVA
jgi:hypothetical protein